MKSGGVLKDYRKVTEIIPGERVTVKTNHGDFSARRVIITAGPWTPKIMKQLGVDLPIVVRYIILGDISLSCFLFTVIMLVIYDLGDKS